jgi:DNA-binding transcriptional LysR family regulator
MESTETSLDLRRLSYFVAVADALSFSRAAADIGVSQQAMSSQIRRLEDEVGQPLFFRTTRQVELSPAGQAFLPRARAVLRSVGEALAAVREVGPDPRYRPWSTPPSAPGPGVTGRPRRCGASPAPRSPVGGLAPR